MKLILVKAFVAVLRILYAPLKKRKTQNKILWLSRQSDEPSLDMRLLSAELTALMPEVEQQFRLKKLRDESSLTPGYIFSVIGDTFAISTAKSVITDTYSIPVSCLKHKKDTEIIQLWHAPGAIKKFSLQSVGLGQGRDAAISEAMCMHKNYTCVIAPSQSTAKFYAEAFGCSESVIKICGLPRLDILLDGKNRRAEFIGKNPRFAGKGIAVYLPTFRDGDGEYSDTLHKAFKEQNTFELAVRMHPLSKTAYSDALHGDFGTTDLIKLADIVITDYSACAFEAALLNKRLYFYLPDYEKYKTERGLNVDLFAELPSASFTDAAELCGALGKEYDSNAVENFSNKYIASRAADNTARLAEIVKEVFER